MTLFFDFTDSLVWTEFDDNFSGTLGDGSVAVSGFDSRNVAYYVHSTQTASDFKVGFKLNYSVNDPTGFMPLIFCNGAGTLADISSQAYAGIYILRSGADPVIFIIAKSNGNDENSALYTYTSGSDLWGTFEKINQFVTLKLYSDAAKTPGDLVADLSSTLDIIETFPNIQSSTVSINGATGGSISGAISEIVDLNAPVTITVADPTQRVFARNSSGTYDLTINGTYDGDTGGIRAAIVADGTDTPITGGAWKVIDATPTGGTYSAVFTDIPAGRGYNVHTSWVNTPANIAKSTYRFGVGIGIASGGQSLEERMFTVGSTLTPNQDLWMYTASGWAQCTGDGAITTGNALITALDLPIVFLNYAVGGARLIYNPNNPTSPYWSDASGTLFTPLADGIVSSGIPPEYFIFNGCETDGTAGVANGATFDAYVTNLGTLKANIEAVTGTSVAMGVPYLARYLSAPLATDANWQIARDGIQQFASLNSDVYTYSKIPFPLDPDGLHLTAAGFIEQGEVSAQAILHHLGLADNPEGMKLLSLELTSPTSTTINLTPGAGADFTPPTGITGIDLLLDDVWTSVTCSRVDATTILAPHSSGVVTGVRALYGLEPNITGILVDNTTLTLPIVSSEVLAAIAEITIGDFVSTNTLSEVTITAPSEILIGDILSNAILSEVILSTTTPAEITIGSFSSATYLSEVSISNKLITGLININITAET